MIVKNEEKVIERCLFSCLKFIDYFVICDTGSTDKTIEVINNFSKKYNLKGEVHQHEWVNFAHNRNLSLEIAKAGLSAAGSCSGSPWCAAGGSPAG